MSPQIQPIAEPINRCSKSRRTNWKRRLRLSSKLCRKSVPGMRGATVKSYNNSIFNNLQLLQLLDKIVSALLHSPIVRNPEAPQPGCGGVWTTIDWATQEEQTMKQEYFVVVVA